MTDEPTLPPRKPPATPEDADRTVIAPMTDRGTGAAPDKPGADDDRTILSQAPRPMPPSGEDADRTVYDASSLTAAPAARTSAPPVPAAAPDSRAQDASAEPIRTLQPGTVINNMYRVEYSLDQGGMGRVFRGVELKMNEPVAIKVILPEMADEKKAAEMFHAEARNLRSLHHDAIVRYFAYFPPDEQMNLHALVMDFIEGITLSARIKQQGPLSTAEMCRLFIRLAQGLNHAHKKGVVHRDLSPDNVMLQNGQIDQSVLIDFGISKSVVTNEGTLRGEFAGKLKYVSPEQLGSFGGVADHRSDIYSLGLMMIAALLGRPAAMGDSIVEAVRQRDAVPDLSGVPAEFQTLLYRMLQPDPNQRLSDMAEVVTTLRDIMDGRTSPGSAFPQPMTATPARQKTVPGLQTAPMGSNTLTATIPGKTAAPSGAQAAPGTAAAGTKSRGGIGLLLSIVVLGAAAIGGALYWSQGGGLSPNSADAPPADAAPGEPRRLPDSDATFLALNVPETCAFATRRASGGIETFGAPGTDFSALLSAATDRFGTRPALSGRPVQSSQCAALDLARAFQGTAAAAIEITLDQNVLSRSEGIVGSVGGSLDRAAWLGIIAPNGRVFSLGGRLSEPANGARSFAFRMPSAQPGPYILVAITSEKALVRTGAMQDGTPAADLIPLIARELSADPQGAVDIGFVDIRP